MLPLWINAVDDALFLPKWNEFWPTIAVVQPYMQIFTNSDKAHVCEVLKRLGLEDCFEDVICFESLNMAYPFNQQTDECKPSTSPVFIKPSIEAIKRAITIANVDPQRTVSFQHLPLILLDNFTMILTPRLSLQLFFDDNVRNIAGAKAAGLNTVLVSPQMAPDITHYSVYVLILSKYRKLYNSLWLTWRGLRSDLFFTEKQMKERESCFINCERCDRCIYSFGQCTWKLLLILKFIFQREVKNYIKAFIIIPGGLMSIDFSLNLLCYFERLAAL